LTTRAGRGQGQAARGCRGWAGTTRAATCACPVAAVPYWPGRPGPGRGRSRAARGQRPGNASMSGGSSAGSRRSLPPSREVSEVPSDLGGRGSPSRLAPAPQARQAPPRPSGSRWVEGEPYAAVQACSTYADRRWRRAPSMRERMTPRCRHELLTVRLSYWRPLPGHHMPLFHTESASSGIQGTLLDRHIRARQCLASGNDIKVKCCVKRSNKRGRRREPAGRPAL